MYFILNRNSLSKSITFYQLQGSHSQEKSGKIVPFSGWSGKVRISQEKSGKNTESQDFLGKSQDMKN